MNMYGKLGNWKQYIQRGEEALSEEEDIGKECNVCEENVVLRHTFLL